MKNKLITEGYRKNEIEFKGHCDETRCTGKSTGIAFELIGEALKNPGKRVDIYDHHSSKEGMINVSGLINNYIVRNGLKFLEIRRDLKTEQYYLYYDLYE